MTEIVPLDKINPEPLSRTVRAFAMVRGDTSIGAAGAFLENGAWVVYSEITPEGWKDTRGALRLWRTVLAAIKDSGIPIQAIADPAIEASERFLEHIGFRRLAGQTFEWKGH